LTDSAWTVLEQAAVLREITELVAAGEIRALSSIARRALNKAKELSK
jgi:hypothetical protein